MSKRSKKKRVSPPPSKESLSGRSLAEVARELEAKKAARLRKHLPKVLSNEAHHAIAYGSVEVRNLAHANAEFAQALCEPSD